MQAMRIGMALLMLTGLAACSPEATVGLLSANAASVAVFGRAIPDLVHSAVTGKDCSVVRLERGQTYCAPAAEPFTQRYCTRTLATVDCWAAAELDPRAGPGVGDTPPPNAAQDRYRAARWPKTITSEW